MEQEPGLSANAEQAFEILKPVGPEGRGLYRGLIEDVDKFLAESNS